MAYRVCQMERGWQSGVSETWRGDYDTYTDMLYVQRHVNLHCISPPFARCIKSYTTSVLTTCFGIPIERVLMNRRSHAWKLYRECMAKFWFTIIGFFVQALRSRQGMLLHTFRPQWNAFLTFVYPPTMWKN